MATRISSTALHYAEILGANPLHANRGRFALAAQHFFKALVDRSPQRSPRQNESAPTGNDQKFLEVGAILRVFGRIEKY